MIEFTDITLIETHGFFDETKKLMEEDGAKEWMLRSSVFVSTQFATATFILHFWNDGRVVISATDHSVTLDASDDDLRELSDWCRKAGWKELQVSNRLLENQQGYHFWKRSFIAGMVMSDILQKHEEEEMTRLSKAIFKEQKEEEEEDGS